MLFKFTLIFVEVGFKAFLETRIRVLHFNFCFKIRQTISILRFLRIFFGEEIKKKYRKFVFGVQTSVQRY